MSRQATSTTELLQGKPVVESELLFGHAASNPHEMPPEAPLDMPLQDFAAQPPLSHVRSVTWRGLMRRFIFVGGGLLSASVSSYVFLQQLSANGIRFLDLPFVAISFILDLHHSLQCLASFLGFCVLIRRAQQPKKAKTVLPKQRTAVLVPIYNENMDDISRRLSIMMKSINELDAESLFELFLLSDSVHAAEQGERAVVAKLRINNPRVALYYRRRPENTAHKPGNLSDWIQRWGGAYEKMIVLDADSIMTGPALAKLAVQMEAQPTVGLIQATSAFNGGSTLFGRWQQFKSAVYMPLKRAGLIWWSGDEATYWGHNAILRTRAFAESCGLPELSGPKPSGGPIMSHDRIEAILMSRRGWGVQVLELDAESYEEGQATVLHHYLNDRRWCQGDLQHLRLFTISGLRWANYMHLALGLATQLTPPLWLLRLLHPSSYLGLWQCVVLVSPRIMGLVLVLARGRETVECFGGAANFILSTLIEIPLAAMMACVAFMSKSTFILNALLRKSSGWPSQDRRADGLSLVVAIRCFRSHMFLGAMFLAIIAARGDCAAWVWFMACSILATPLIAFLTSHVSTGTKARELGIFLTPIEASGVC